MTGHLAAYRSLLHSGPTICILIGISVQSTLNKCKIDYMGAPDVKHQTFT